MNKITGIIGDYYLQPLINTVISGSIPNQTFKAVEFPRHSMKNLILFLAEVDHYDSTLSH